MAKKGDDDKEEKGSNYLVRAFTAFFLVFIISSIFQNAIFPFTMFQSFWTTKGDVEGWLLDGYPMLLWGIIATMGLWLFRSKPEISASEENKIFWGGLVVSTWAGVVEEICFRWLIFLNCLWGAKFGNLILCGFPEWLYMHSFGPVANFFTFGLMQEHLYHPASWAVGTSILSANAAFRNGHKYQGWLGIINSWYIGMFLFWVMFRYGLLAAIFLHFLYDFLIFTSVYLAFMLRRKLT